MAKKPDIAVEIALQLIEYRAKAAVDQPVSEYIIGCFVAASMLLHQIPYADHLKAVEVAKKMLDDDFRKRTTK